MPEACSCALYEQMPCFMRMHLPSEPKNTASKTDAHGKCITWDSIMGGRIMNYIAVMITLKLCLRCNGGRIRESFRLSHVVRRSQARPVTADAAPFFWSGEGRCGMAPRTLATIRWSAATHDDCASHTVTVKITDKEYLFYSVSEYINIIETKA